YVFAELANKFAVGTAKTVRRITRDDENAENTARHRQRRGHKRIQAAAGKPLWKWICDGGCIRLVYEFSPNARGQSVLVYRNTRLRGHRKLDRQRFALRSDAENTQEFLGGIVQTDTSEIDRQIAFEAADHDLKNTRQILPFRRRTRDSFEQFHPA